MHRRLQFVLDVGVALAVFVADYVIMVAISEDRASAVPT